MDNGFGLPAALVAIGLCGVALATGALPNVVSVPAGLMVTLWAPGYVLTRALYPSSGSLAAVERLLLTVGLSLGVLVLNGVALNATEPGVTGLTMYALLAGEVVLLTLIAWGRGAALPKPAAARQAWVEHRTPALLAASALLALTATAWRLAAAPVAEPYIEFYTLGQDALLARYPTEAVVGQPFSLPVGVGNHQPHPATYRLVVRQGTSDVGAGDPGSIGANQIWEGQVSVTPASAGPRERFELLLLPQGEGTALRRLSITLAVRDLAPPAATPTEAGNTGEPQPSAERSDQE